MMQQEKQEEQQDNIFWVEVGVNTHFGFKARFWFRDYETAINFCHLVQGRIFVEPTWDETVEVYRSIPALCKGLSFPFPDSFRV